MIIHTLYYVPPAMSALARVAKVNSATTAFFVCDIQERFRSLIWQFPSLISTSTKMVSVGLFLGNGGNAQFQRD